MTLFVGLTGGVATGKSAVLDRLKQLGAETFSADDVVHSLFMTDSQLRTEIADAFGPEFVYEDGVRRNLLGERVFNNPDERRCLEEMVHPRVRNRMIEWMDDARSRDVNVAVAEVPLLFEAGFERDFHVVVAVVSEPDVQLSRLLKKVASEDDARTRISAQMDLAEKRERADLVVVNNGSLADLDEQVKALWQTLLKKTA